MYTKYSSNNNYKNIQNKCNSYKPKSINLEVYNIACQLIMKRYQETPNGSASHEEIVAEAYAKAENLFASGVMADRLAPNGTKIPSSSETPTLVATSASFESCAAMKSFSSFRYSPATTLDSPTSSGYVSEEDISSSGKTSGYSSGIDSGVSSGSVSPAPINEPTKKLSIGTPGVDFVFNIGAANATASCHRTIKVDLGDGSFEMIVDPNSDSQVPKKVKVFTAEELEKQAEIVAEFRRNILGSAK